jgi:hypothetical protein
MNAQTYNVLSRFAEECEALALQVPSAYEQVESQRTSVASDYDLGMFAGYAVGKASAYRDMADDIRELLRGNLPRKQRTSWWFGFISVGN